MAEGYQFKKYNYKVTIGSIGDMEVSEISTGDISYEPIEHREGDRISYLSGKMQGMMYSSVTLKYGITANKEVFDWLSTTQSVMVKQEDVKIELLSDTCKNVLAAWILQKAIPIKFVHSNIKTSRNEFVIESVEIACEAIMKRKVNPYAK